MAKPVVSHDLCIGCGTCEGLCPETFKLVDGKSTVVEGGACSEEKLQEAVQSCPVGAISLE